jgi:hypothetical protein
MKGESGIVGIAILVYFKATSRHSLAKAGENHGDKICWDSIHISRLRFELGIS